MPSEYLLVMHEPSASITAIEVKFSEAMSSMPSRWRTRSFSMISYTSGSDCLSEMLGCVMAKEDARSGSFDVARTKARTFASVLKKAERANDAGR